MGGPLASVFYGIIIFYQKKVYHILTDIKFFWGWNVGSIDLRKKYGRAGGPGHALICAHVVGMCVLAVACIFFTGGQNRGPPEELRFYK